MDPKKDSSTDVSCKLGHLVLQEGAIVCGGSGHTTLDRMIHVEELVAWAIHTGQLDLKKVVRLSAEITAGKRGGDLVQGHPPRHHLKLVTVMREGETLLGFRFTEDGRFFISSEFNGPELHGTWYRIEKKDGGHDMISNEGYAEWRVRHHGWPKFSISSYPSGVETMSRGKGCSVAVGGFAGPVFDEILAGHCGPNKTFWYLAQTGEKIYKVSVSLG